jgi:hypothetical protein
MATLISQDEAQRSTVFCGTLISSRVSLSGSSRAICIVDPFTCAQYNYPGTWGTCSFAIPPIHTNSPTTGPTHLSVSGIPCTTLLTANVNLPLWSSGRRTGLSTCAIETKVGGDGKREAKKQDMKPSSLWWAGFPQVYLSQRSQFGFHGVRSLDPTARRAWPFWVSSLAKFWKHINHVSTYSIYQESIWHTQQPCTSGECWRM